MRAPWSLTLERDGCGQRVHLRRDERKPRFTAP